MTLERIHAIITNFRSVYHDTRVVMQEKPEIIRSEIVATTQLFCIERMHLRFANGEERVYERLLGRGHGAVMIVPMLDAQTVLLVREYYAGVDRYELALPKGLIEAGEAILAAANREIMEEVGYGAKQLEIINELSISPGYWDRKMQIVLAQELYPAKLPGDEPEEIEVLPWRLDNLDALFAREDFSEARSFAALFLAREKLQHG